LGQEPKRPTTLSNKKVIKHPRQIKMSRKPEREMYLKKAKTMENLLTALEEKSRKPGISAPEQDHINKTIKTLWKGLKDLKSYDQSVVTDPESEDFVNPLDPIETNETGIPTSASERISRTIEVTADKRIQDFRNQEKVDKDIEIFPQR